MGSHYYYEGSTYAHHHTHEHGILNHKSDSKSTEPNLKSKLDSHRQKKSIYENF